MAKLDLVHNYKFDSKQYERWGAIVRTPGFRRRMKSIRQNKGQPVLPDAISDHRKTLNYLRELGETLGASKSLQIHLDSKSGMVGSNAVAGDFLALGTVTGHGMNPISVPPVSNAPICDDLGLAKGFASARHEKIAQQLMKLMFGRAAPAKLSIRKAANMGPPDFTPGSQAEEKNCASCEMLSPI